MTSTAPARQDGQEYASSTYLLTSVPAFLQSITYRMLADGMVLPDIHRADGIGDWSGWGEFWMACGRQHEALGNAALAAGRALTAGGHLVRGSLAAHYGQFLYFDFPDVKQRAVELKARLYKEAAPHLAFRTVAVEIPFRDGSLPAYLRLPVGDGPFPTVVLVGGLDAAKEDSHQFSQLCLDRGLATLALDGPGQGEALYRGFHFEPDFHAAISSAVDWLHAEPWTDRDRIGIIGRSLGGFLAPQAAALDPRIRACVAWGALYDLGSFDAKPPLIREGYRFITGARDWADAKERTRFVSLAGIAERITCPLYVVHGLKDNSVPPANAERLVREARGDTKLWLVPDSIHCNHEVAHLVRPDMADWLAEQLR